MPRSPTSVDNKRKRSSKTEQGTSSSNHHLHNHHTTLPTPHHTHTTPNLNQTSTTPTPHNTTNNLTPPPHANNNAARTHTVPTPNFTLAAPNSATKLPTATSPALSEPDFPAEEDLPHLCCGVCLCFPETEVVQCSAGHILCRDCHSRVCHSDKPLCPTCREPLDVVKPIRNMLAERSLAMLRVRCPNNCAAALTRGSLASHLASECPLRAALCKYAPLGCRWTGVQSALLAHEDLCKKAHQPGGKLIKRVAKMRSEEKERNDAVLTEARAGMRVCEALSMRCRNIEFTAVALHKCSHEHVAGKPAHLTSHDFYACGSKWKVYTIALTPSSGGARTYSAVLQLRDRTHLNPRGHATVEYFFLRGEPLEHDLRITTRSHTFDKRRTTDPVVLAEGAAAEHLEGMETLWLRLCVIDKRAGRPDRSFYGQVSNHGYDYPGENDWADDHSGSESAGSEVSGYASFDDDATISADSDPSIQIGSSRSHF